MAPHHTQTKIPAPGPVCPGPCPNLLPHFLVLFPLLTSPQPHWHFWSLWTYKSPDWGFLAICSLSLVYSSLKSWHDWLVLPFRFQITCHPHWRKNVFFIVFITICNCFNYVVYFFMICLPAWECKFYWSKDFVIFNTVFSVLVCSRCAVNIFECISERIAA